MRQTGGGVCRLRTRSACYTSPEEGSVEKSLRFQARRALLQQAVPQYRKASQSQKRTQLDAFVAATRYHRTYARWLLNHAEEGCCHRTWWRFRSAPVNACRAGFPFIQPSSKAVSSSRSPPPSALSFTEPPQPFGGAPSQGLSTG